MTFKAGDLVQVRRGRAYQNLVDSLRGTFGDTSKRIATVLNRVGRVISIDQKRDLIDVRWSTRTSYDMFAEEIELALGPIMQEAVGEV